MKSKSRWSTAVSARWVLSIGIAGAVLYGSAEPAKVWPHYTLVAAVLVGNGLLAWRWSRITSKLAVWLVVLADVAAVTVTIALTRQASADLYLFYFVVLLAAATTHSWGAYVTVTLGTCGLYGGVLYASVGNALFYDTALLMRVPFLLCVSIFVGLAAQRARIDNATAERMAKALSEIGEQVIGVGSTREVLYRVAREIQESFRVQRCSLILFDDDHARGFLAASSDDPRVAAREIPIKKYPEIRAALKTRSVVELRADTHRSLWRRVETYLPENSRFRSFLVVPVILRGVVRGVYLLRCTDVKRSFSESEKSFCQVVAMMTSTFVHERELERELASRPQQALPTAAPETAHIADEVDKVAKKLAAQDPGALDAAALDAAAESLVTVQMAA